jgi:hypothetical protein
MGIAAVRKRPSLGGGEGERRIAYCKCGARLAANSDRALREAAQQHVALHHPDFLRGPSAVRDLGAEAPRSD